MPKERSLLHLHLTRADHAELGPRATESLHMVLREALTLVILGIVIGVPAGLAASRLIATMFYGLKATDRTTIWRQSEWWLRLPL